MSTVLPARVRAIEVSGGMMMEFEVFNEKYSKQIMSVQFTLRCNENDCECVGVISIEK